MQEERLKQIIEEELKKPNRPKLANDFLHLIWSRQGFNFNDPDHRKEMPSHETVSRIARDLRKNNPELRGSQEEQDRRQELEKENRDKYSKQYPATAKYIKG